MTTNKRKQDRTGQLSTHDSNSISKRGFFQFLQCRTCRVVLPKPPRVSAGHASAACRGRSDAIANASASVAVFRRRRRRL